ncbi:MAG: hypothetical protein RL352_673 [Actinomycetota bacterium]
MCIVCQGVAIAVSILTPMVPAHSTEQPAAADRPGVVAEVVASPAANGAAFSTAADLTGKTCRAVGTTRKVGTVTYRCTSTRGILRWRATATTISSTVPNKITTTTLRPAVGHFAATCGSASSPCPTTSTATFDISACKVADMTYRTHDGGSQGFPRPPRAKAGKASLNILVFPIRYQGMTIAESTVRQRFDLEFKQSQEFMTRNSYGKVDLNFIIPPASEWPQLDVTPQQFVSARDTDLLRVTQDALNLITRTDLGTYDSIFVVAADGGWYYGGGGGVFEHPSGQLYGVYFQTGPATMANFPHNLGHTAYYFEDLYIHQYYLTRPNIDPFPMRFDIMSTGPDYSGWNRWLAGFLTDNEVVCLPDTGVTTLHRVTHINRTDGQRLVVLPITTGKALFAEYIDNAVHIYELDSFIPHGAGPLKTLGTITPGRTATFGGVTFNIRGVDTQSIYLEIQR